MAFTRVATYRIQLTPDFGFSEAAGIVPDLADLGVSHVYLSPVAEAVPGSTHGYDVVKPWEVRDELGGREGLWDLARKVRDADMGLILDVVPNHVATTEPERNPWWWALLAEGRGSDASDYFDVDWHQGDGRVIVPTLGAPLDDVIASGELVVEHDRVRYYNKTFPLTAANPRSEDPDSPADVRGLLDSQHYQLTHWRNPDRNVRRFFTIDDLAAVRPEVPVVANAIGSIAEELAIDELLEGVRVDHIDGLAEPSAYLEDLRSRIGEDAWLLVEKVVVGEETLPETWPVDGTTGYEWIRVIDHLFTSPTGEAVFSELSGGAGGPVGEGGYHDTERAAVREVLRGELLPDLERLARVTASVLVGRSSGLADPIDPIDPATLLEPLIELTAHLGRYRTYLPTDLAANTAQHRFDETVLDETVLDTAAQRARERLDLDQGALLELVLDVIRSNTEVTRRWQQLSGPALAKGGEDRALYRWIRLGAHNEVGGNPGVWSVPLDAFHDHNARVAATNPGTLLAGTTHDTKRSEDTRARLLALAEVPALWAKTVNDWIRELEHSGAPLSPVRGPELALALQTVVAAWPIDAQRLGDYLVKAAREADVLTSWTDPDPDHENGLRHLAGLLTSDPFTHRIKELLGVLAPLARSISLAQLALRLTSPGVPDLYQGSEGWLHTLVDPDNRGRLDTGVLRATVRAATTAESPWDSTVPKAALIKRILTLRAAAPECFQPGSGYHQIRAVGTYADRVVAFMRTPPGTEAARDSVETDAVISVASRFPSSGNDWHDTRIDLPDRTWTDVLANRRIHRGPTALGDLLGEHAAAVLVPAVKQG